jgi:hypothetical protein
MGVLAAILGAGCSSGTTTSTSSPDRDAVFAVEPPEAGAASQASVMVGGAVIVDVAPAQDAGTATVAAGDPSIALVAPMTTPGKFVVVGLAVGSTPLHVLVDGRKARAILSGQGPSSSVSVVVQPSPSPW